MSQTLGHDKIETIDSGAAVKDGNRVQLWMGAMLFAIWLGLAAAFDATIAASVGHNENWLLGLVLFAPVALVGLVLIISSRLGASFDSRHVAAPILTIAAIPFATFFFPLFYTLPPYLFIVLLVCVTVCILVFWKPRLWPVSILILLVPALIAWCAVFYGNLTYKHTKANSYRVETYAELKDALTDCDGIRFPDLTMYESASGMQYNVYFRRDVWLKRCVGYWVASAADNDATGMNARLPSNHMSKLSYVSACCRDTRIDYGEGFPFLDVLPNAKIGDTDANLAWSEFVLGDSWREESYRGFHEGDTCATCKLTFVSGNYQYELTGECGVLVGATEEEALNIKDEVERELREIASSIVIQ